MLTSWGQALDRDSVLPEYPRPQLQRDSYLNLNGVWRYAITASAAPPETWDGDILVPFSPECVLSGVERVLAPGEYLWYSRSFTLPEGFSRGRVLLNFGAVDQTATVYLNGQELLTHVGGYLPFTVELTAALAAENQLAVRVRDDTDEDWHTRGKQKRKRGGIWYTAQSGIWQTVWLESVPAAYIKRLAITPVYDGGLVEIGAEVAGKTRPVAHFGGADYPLPARIPVPDFEPWSPENPRLYDFTVTCGDDEVKSYFAMRKFSVEADDAGVRRLCLNGRPYFHNGLLDQGYWPDGLYTAPSDEAMIYDIELARRMGFNMLRKHIKVEPARWYYHCDRLGMLVWQDMPCGGGVYSPPVVSAPLVTGRHLRDNAYFLFGRGEKAGREEFERELRDMVTALYNCPCIALWVPFNEGWGQFDAARLYDVVRGIDDTRPVDHASGWHDQHVGEVQSLHVYFKKYVFRPDRLGRAVLLSEFGGYNHRVGGHCFGDRDFGYKKFESPLALESALRELYADQIVPARRQGLSAAVYTQLTDVEDELNGLVTYDRKVVKIPIQTLKSITKV
ncbi:MAG TPA: glycoside hydrolase family 2 TIM barrel-domain containing protein, partial [Oscillospiraceae bacterium]|nr:glycoside hydrolase family 2 TIM barrel-domain containing protein [Oscillospiraceae bacterium]